MRLVGCRGVSCGGCWLCVLSVFFFSFFRVIVLALHEGFFVEGLILAQDERWRRA